MEKEELEPFERLLRGNFEYQWKIIQGMEDVEIKGLFPKLPILILTCMDPRIDVYRIFQLKPGDVFVLRNAGNYVTDDVLRSILIAIHEYRIKYIIVLGHIDCEIPKVLITEFKEKLYPAARQYILKSGVNVLLQIKKFFNIFYDELKNVNEQAERLLNFRGIPQEVEISSMLYDASTGWVFEYEMIKNLKNIESFHTFYQDLLTKKRYKLIDFLESIEEEIIGEENIQSQSSLVEVEPIKRPQSINHPLESQTYKDKSSNIFQFNRTIVHIPKINFPKVKVSIPNIYRKKKNDNIM